MSKAYFYQRRWHQESSRRWRLFYTFTTWHKRATSFLSLVGDAFHSHRNEVASTNCWLTHDHFLGTLLEMIPSTVGLLWEKAEQGLFLFPIPNPPRPRIVKFDLTLRWLTRSRVPLNSNLAIFVSRSYFVLFSKSAVTLSLSVFILEVLRLSRETLSNTHWIPAHSVRRTENGVLFSIILRYCCKVAANRRTLRSLATATASLPRQLSSDLHRCLLNQDP